MTSVFKSAPFDHNHIERFLIAVGNLFSGITVQKFNATGDKIQSYIVPVEYAARDKWISRLREQANLEGPQLGITLPRMSFELTDVQYAPERKIGVNGTYAIGTVNGMRGKIFPPTPYDVIFNVYCMTKDQKNDSMQVMEQILPYFQPYMTINYEILPEYKIFKDIPISFQSYEVDDAYEGSPEDQRTVVQTFTFSAQMDFFGPMLASTAIIKHTLVDFTFTPTGTNITTLASQVTPLTANANDKYTIVDTITDRI
jgi:hypothetical protein